MRDLPRYEPPRRPVWLLYLLWVLSVTAVCVYTAIVAQDPPAEQPQCVTHLECPTDIP